MSRYNNYKILNNSSKYYQFLRKKRNGIKNIQQYETPVLYHPDMIDRASLNTTTHVWTVGDRYYKLADQFYGVRLPHRRFAHNSTRHRIHFGHPGNGIRKWLLARNSDPTIRKQINSSMTTAVTLRPACRAYKRVLLLSMPQQQ